MSTEVVRSARLFEVTRQHFPGGSSESSINSTPPGLGEFYDAVLSVLWLLEQREGDVSAAEMEEIIGRKKRQSTKIFHNLAGKTFREAQLRARLFRSRALVRNTSRPIAAIAEEFGYSRRTKFDQSYLRLFNVTPAADRATHQKKEILRVHLRGSTANSPNCIVPPNNPTSE